MTDNAVLRLRQFRLDRATRPFWRAVAGWRVVRVACCRIKLPVRHHSSAAGRQPFLPDHVRRRAAQASNTGRLIADILPDTQAFLWSRTEIDPALLAAINDPARQPYVVFPASYADAERPVFSQLPAGGKPPLFIMLDGTWAEARKMFRKARTSINSRCFPSTSTRHRTTSCAKPAAPSNTARRKWPPPCCNRRAICRPPTD